jgi:hypothetical protein
MGRCNALKRAAASASKVPFLVLQKWYFWGCLPVSRAIDAYPTSGANAPADTHCEAKTAKLFWLLFSRKK